MVYNATISACGGSGAWLAVVQLLSDMQDKQIRSDNVTFGAVINSWKKSGLWQHAVLQLAELTQTPNLIMYNAAIATCEKGGAWETALSLLTELSQLKLRSDVATLSSIMSSCVRCTQPDHALHLFSIFRGAHCRANAPWLDHVGILSFMVLLEFVLGCAIAVESRSDGPMQHRQHVLRQ